VNPEGLTKKISKENEDLEILSQTVYKIILLLAAHI
jgi:hypothetical protein